MGRIGKYINFLFTEALRTLYIARIIKHRTECNGVSQVCGDRRHMCRDNFG